MQRDLYLTPESVARVRAEIARARGNEVCFVARVDGDGAVLDPQAVARGHASAVLAAVAQTEPGMLVLHNHPSGMLDPSDADMQVAAELHARGLGLGIVDNAVDELYVVLEPARPREREPLDAREIETLLAPGGALSRAHGAYEDRPAQREFAQRIAALFNEGGITLAEAGTGTGKSVAYLLPAVQWAVRNEERVLVSTNTINLQEQLVTKDLPLLRRTLGESFRFALVKGRGNYVSIRRAHLAAQSQGALFEDRQQQEVAAILEWLEGTRDGSLQDLSFAPTAEVWDEVVSETDVCLRARCPHFQECFYQRARRDATVADVLVVNHSLLFSDLALRRAQQNWSAPAVLPPYHHVILDEAHNVEEAATSHLGVSVSRRGLLRLLNRLDRKGRGVLLALESRLQAPEADDITREEALAAVREARPLVERAREHGIELFRRLDQLLGAADEGVIRLGEGFAADPAWVDSLAPVLENLTFTLARLSTRLMDTHDRVSLDRNRADALAEPLLELRAAAGRVMSADAALRLALAPGGSDPVPTVRWIERRGDAGRDGGNVAVCTAPVEIGEALRDALFERADTVILTSATLATRDGFEFMRQRLGLNGGGLRISEAVYASPFDFERQAVVAIPTDLPGPHESESAFDSVTAAVAADVAGCSDGGVFVLFTSYRALRAVAGLLRSSGTAARWPLFVQGEGSRARLLEAFTEAGRGVLLGVSSFWEGVDVPGEPLRGLVIAKLPFKVPSEPLTAARIEAVEQLGGSGFREYLLPHAALRLKQGFGRLIRSRSDRGAVVLLDRRVVERGYGRYFLESLPPAPVKVGPWSELRDELEAFYSGVTVRRGGGVPGVAGEPHAD